MRNCLELIKCGEDYYRFMHLRSLKEAELNAAKNKQPVKQQVDDEDEDEEEEDPLGGDSDEEEEGDCKDMLTIYQINKKTSR